MAAIDQLPEPIRATIEAFVAGAREAFGEDLVSVTLFGSAAEGRLRPTSDVNVIIVLSRCDPVRLAAIGDAYRLAHAAIRLSTMFILDTEVAGATEAFAVKFSDITARHEVLYGSDVFAGLTVSRQSQLHRLRQVVMNLLLRLRERYALSSAYPEQLIEAAAESVGPLRACAATLLSLESGAGVPPREALQQVAADAAGSDALGLITRAREQGPFATSDPAATLLAAINLAAMLQVRVARVV